MTHELLPQHGRGARFIARAHGDRGLGKCDVHIGPWRKMRRHRVGTGKVHPRRIEIARGTRTYERCSRPAQRCLARSRPPPPHRTSTAASVARSSNSPMCHRAVVYDASTVTRNAGSAIGRAASSEVKKPASSPRPPSACARNQPITASHDSSRTPGGTVSSAASTPMLSLDDVAQQRTSDSRQPARGRIARRRQLIDPGCELSPMPRTSRFHHATCPSERSRLNSPSASPASRKPDHRLAQAVRERDRAPSTRRARPMRADPRAPRPTDVGARLSQPRSCDAAGRAPARHESRSERGHFVPELDAGQQSERSVATSPRGEFASGAAANGDALRHPGAGSHRPTARARAAGASRRHRRPRAALRPGS